MQMGWQITELAKEDIVKRKFIVIASAAVVMAGFGVALGQATFHYPKIASHGKVVRLADAAAQPRAGSRICVDVTTDGPADAVNPGILKLARYVNIYGGAGAAPAEVRITAILHGKATMVALSDDAHASRLGTKGNPNLPLLRELRDAGVELLVCGQSAAGLGIASSEIAPEVQTAVSALTANVNRQMDGYAYIPLH